MVKPCRDNMLLLARHHIISTSQQFFKQWVKWLAWKQPFVFYLLPQCLIFVVCYHHAYAAGECEIRCLKRTNGCQANELCSVKTCHSYCRSDIDCPPGKQCKHGLCYRTCSVSAVALEYIPTIYTVKLYHAYVRKIGLEKEFSFCKWRYPLEIL